MKKKERNHMVLKKITYVLIKNNPMEMFSYKCNVTYFNDIDKTMLFIIQIIYNNDILHPN